MELTGEKQEQQIKKTEWFKKNVKCCANCEYWGTFILRPNSNMCSLIRGKWCMWNHCCDCYEGEKEIEHFNFDMIEQKIADKEIDLED